MQKVPLALTAILAFAVSCASRKNRDSDVEVRCLSLREGRDAIVDESHSPYFSILERAEIAALTGRTVDEPDLTRCRDIARERFQEAVLEFTDAEEAAIRELVREIRDAIDEHFPLVSKSPWRFIKTRKTLCGGFSRTRGSCIILSEERVRGLTGFSMHSESARERRRYAKLFVHEKLHVLQRTHQPFEQLYEGVFGWKHGVVEDHRWIRERQISNPDGVDLGWLYPVTDESGNRRIWWPRTLLATVDGVPRMGHDFLGRVIELERSDQSTYRVIAASDEEPPTRMLELHEFSPLTKRFPVRSGLDHPNEIAAYLFADLVSEKYLPRIDDDSSPERTSDQEALIDAFHAWCREHLR